MNEYRSNLTLDQVLTHIRQAKRIAITTHSKPDGDAFGSVVALASALRQLGSEVWPWFIPPVPAVFNDLKGRELVQEFKSSVAYPAVDLQILVDTGAWSQVSPMREVLSEYTDRMLIIDHHLAGDVPAAWRYIDHQAAACCEVIAELIDGLEKDTTRQHDLYTPTVCDALFAGVVSDTGWFRFSNTRAKTHDLASRLIRQGVDQAQMYLQLEQRARPEKLALQVRALESLQWHAEGRVALMILRSEDFLETGAVLEETERFVDMPQSVLSVEVVVLITQPPHHRGKNPSSGEDQPIRLSFRSRAGQDAVDVARLAAKFGGGGHARAAGAKVRVPLDQVIEQVAETTMSFLHA